MINHVEREIAPIGSQAFAADPYPTYAHLRSRGTVHRDAAAPIWHVMGYRNVHICLRDSRLAAARSGLFLSEGQRQHCSALAGILPNMMVFADPPRHTRLRGLVSKAFTPRVVEGLRERIQTIVDDLLTRVAVTEEFDVIADLAVPLPTLVIGELLGIPNTDRGRLKAWADDVAAFIGGPTDHDGVLAADRAIHELTQYFGQAIARSRQMPDNSLLSMLAAEERDESLTTDELLATCVLLLVGGHETTTNLIGNGLLALLRHRDQLQRLRTEPSLIGQAVEELLRYDSPAQMTTRLAMDDLPLGGAQIRRGELVKLWLGAANRDPAQFFEPDRLDIGRTDNHHLSFGHGIHFCIGASLARLEGRVALAALVARFPSLQHTSEPLEYYGTQVFRALKRLPVTS